MRSQRAGHSCVIKRKRQTRGYCRQGACIARCRMTWQHSIVKAGCGSEQLKHRFREESGQSQGWKGRLGSGRVLCRTNGFNTHLLSKRFRGAPPNTLSIVKKLKWGKGKGWKIRPWTVSSYKRTYGYLLGVGQKLDSELPRCQSKKGNVNFAAPMWTKPVAQKKQGFARTKSQGKFLHWFSSKAQCVDTVEISSLH